MNIGESKRNFTLTEWLNKKIGCIIQNRHAIYIKIQTINPNGALCAVSKSLSDGKLMIGLLIASENQF